MIECFFICIFLSLKICFADCKVPELISVWGTSFPVIGVGDSIDLSFLHQKCYKVLFVVLGNT